MLCPSKLARLVDSASHDSTCSDDRVWGARTRLRSPLRAQFGWPGGRGRATSAEVLLVGLGCALVLCLFYAEIIFQNRTFLPVGYPAEVMGPAPPWGFTGTIRTNPWRLDAGGSAWQLEPWARTVAH